MIIDDNAYQLMRMNGTSTLIPQPWIYFSMESHLQRNYRQPLATSYVLYGDHRCMHLYYLQYILLEKDSELGLI